MFSWISTFFLKPEEDNQQQEANPSVSSLPDQTLSTIRSPSQENESSEDKPQQEPSCYTETCNYTTDRTPTCQQHGTTLFKPPYQTIQEPYNVRLKWERKRQSFRRRHLKNKNYFPSLEQMRIKRRQRTKKKAIKKRLEEEKLYQLRKESEIAEEPLEQEMNPTLVNYDEDGNKDYESFYLSVFDHKADEPVAQTYDDERCIKTADLYSETFQHDEKVFEMNHEDYTNLPAIEERLGKVAENDKLKDQEDKSGKTSSEGEKSHGMESFNSEDIRAYGLYNDYNDDEDDDYSDDSSANFSAVISASLLGHPVTDPFVVQSGELELVTLLEQPTTSI